jgi:hypothetical protein
MPAAARNQIALWVLIAIVATGSMTGCAGYQLGVNSLYPPDIRTVYVPVFQSDSFRRNLGERLTEAVIKEIELKTPFKVVSSLDADSELNGRITGTQKRVLVENRNDEPRALEINFQVEINWVDRRGNTIMQPTAIPLSSVLLSFNQSTDFVPEAGQSIATAQQEAIQRLAEQIVTQMETQW